uniref:TPX2 C-terminal domain-containing protein n=1 Tax=Kalanchoe fedtschenkoi TaxID=63787 RepID=A0A7N0V2E7_KALFE
MDAKSAGSSTPVKRDQTPRAKTLEGAVLAENVNPNVAKSSPAAKSAKSGSKSGMKTVAKSSSLLVSPRNLMRERRFVVAKKNRGSNVCGKCREKGVKKCLCAAYESLRASQETFFGNLGGGGGDRIEMCEGGGGKDGNLENGALSGRLEVGGSRGGKPRNGADQSGREAGGGKDGNLENGADGVNQSGRSEASRVKDGGFENGVQRGRLGADEIRGENHKNGADGVDQSRRFEAADGKVGNLEDRAGGAEEESELSSATFKRNRDKLLEEARESVPEPGSGRVMHLVKAFEKLLTMRKKSAGGDGDGEEEKEAEGESAEFYNRFMHRKVVNWALPGMQAQKEGDELNETMSSLCPSDLYMTSEKLGLDSRSSLDSSAFGSFTASSGAGGGRRSRRSSIESCGSFGGSRWKKKQLRVTSQKPFKLRTEQRGRMKEEELMAKIRRLMAEQERLRIPIAQGLPWTTDEPEFPVKPPVKECTRPIDLKLRSDIRAAERAEFDHQVAEKMSLIEQYKMERERQQKLAEEEEIRRLRKELVPKAQPMPYFDRPFVPRRSEKSPTVPKEPKFHIPQHKKIRCMSLMDFSPFTYHQ